MLHAERHDAARTSRSSSSRTRTTGTATRRCSCRSSNPTELWHARDGPQAQPRVPPAGGRAARGHGRCDLHPEQVLRSTCRRRRARSRRSRICRGTRTGRCRSCNEPAVITCSDVMAEQHPELVVAFLKGMIKVGRWCNEHKHAAAAILDQATFYLDVEDTYRSIKNVDFVPSLSPQNLAADRGRQGLHAEPRLHQERLRRAEVGRARVPRTGGEGS